MFGQFLNDQTVRQVLREFPASGFRISIQVWEISVSEDYLRGCTLSEWRASKAESRTFEECAPSLNEIRMEYSLSDLPRPKLRSYSSNLQKI